MDETTEPVAQFGHHPDPLIDALLEVERLEGLGHEALPLHDESSDETATAKVIEAGDLQYKIWKDKETLFNEGRWKREDFPRSMLIQFETEEDFRKAINEKVVYLWIPND